MNISKRISKMLFFVVIAFVMTFTLTTAVKAAPSKVTGLKQTDHGTNSISLEWNALLDNGIRYEVVVSTDKKNWVVKEDRAYSNTEYVHNLNAGTTYYVKVRGYVEESSKQYGEYSNIVTCVTSPNSKPKNLKKTDSTTNSITLNWSKVPGANCYVVEYKKSSASYDTKYSKKVVTSTKVTLTKLSKNTDYRVYVYPARRAGSKGYVAAASSDYEYISGVGTTPTQVSGVQVPYYWDSIGEIKVECTPKESADGYQYEVWTAYKSKDTKVTSTTGGSYGYLKSTALKKKNFFKVRVRGYAENSNGSKKYGQWSSWKYVCQQPRMVNISCISKGIKYSWDKIQGAYKYDLYVSLKKDSGYKKAASVKKSNYTLTKFNKKSLKKGKTYYAYVVAYNKVGKKLYSGEAGDANSCWYITYNR
ncbi:MAG: fibronectin type III domain-containing protein [Lachnospiraceae bacterium]|nr:fibronectin type III domain-containing protein [Lachnospiraceae bacterium]